MLRDYEIKSEGHSEQATCYIELKGDKVCIGLLEEAYMRQGNDVVTMYGVFSITDTHLIKDAIETYHKDKNQEKKLLSDLIPGIHL
jgi:hypothetical protein